MTNIFPWIFVIPVVFCCCIPNQWEGNLGIKFGVVDNGQLSPGWEFYNISYDALNGKIAMVGHIGFEHSEWFEQILQDFKSGKQYAVKAGTCKVTALDSSQITCLPSNATIVRSAYFGVGFNRLIIDFYEFIKTSSSVEVSILQDGCVPVTEFLNFNGTIAELHYLNITEGITNKKAFDIPSSCENIKHVSKKQQYRHAGIFLRL